MISFVFFLQEAVYIGNSGSSGKKNEGNDSHNIRFCCRSRSQLNLNDFQCSIRCRGVPNSEVNRMWKVWARAGGSDKTDFPLPSCLSPPPSRILYQNINNNGAGS